jgi:hypothetical protein
VFSVGSVLRLYDEYQRDKSVSLKESVESSEYAVISWDTGPSEVVADDRPWWRRRSPHCCKPLRSNAEFVVRQSPASKDVDTETEDSTRWESLPDNRWKQQSEKTLRAIVKCRACELTIELELLVVTFCNSSVHSISNPNPVYIHLSCNNIKREERLKLSKAWNPSTSLLRHSNTLIHHEPSPPPNSKERRTRCMIRVGWVTAGIEFVLLLHNTPIGSGIDLTNYYKYQRYVVIHHINSDDGARDNLWNVDF